LNDLLAKVRDSIKRHDSGVDSGGEFESLRIWIDRLRIQVLKHFSEEEQGGCLEEAVARLPRLAAAANEIQAERERLRKLLAELVESERAAESDHDQWRVFVDEFVVLAEQLLKHKSQECSVISEGFNINLTDS